MTPLTNFVTLLLPFAFIPLDKTSLWFALALLRRHLMPLIGSTNYLFPPVRDGAIACDQERECFGFAYLQWGGAGLLGLLTH